MKFKTALLLLAVVTSLLVGCNPKAPVTPTPIPAPSIGATPAATLGPTHTASPGPANIVSPGPTHTASPKPGAGT